MKESVIYVVKKLGLMGIAVGVVTLVYSLGILVTIGLAHAIVELYDFSPQLAILVTALALGFYILWFLLPPLRERGSSTESVANNV